MLNKYEKNHFKHIFLSELKNSLHPKVGNP